MLLAIVSAVARHGSTYFLTDMQIHSIQLISANDGHTLDVNA